MLFQLNIMLTEEDYLAYNNFHSFESAHGKKQIRKSRITIIAIMAFLLVFVVFMLGWTPVSIAYTIALGLFTALYMLLFKKILMLF